MSKNNKGFFFVVASLILLVYILTNLAFWSETIAIQEQRYSENFKISNLDYAANQITEDNIIEFSKISVDYALYKLSNHSIENPVKEGTDWEYENINYSIMGLMLNGSADGNYFSTNTDLTYTEDELSSYTFSGFFSALNNSFSKVNLELKDPKIDNFYFNQSSINTVNVSFSLYLLVVDLEGQKASIERSMDISFNFSIEGLNDPSITREMHKLEFGNQEVEKQIFLYDPDPNFDIKSHLEIQHKGSGEGHGWFYGPVFDASAGGDPPSEELRYLYAIYGTEDEISNSENYEGYGAYLVNTDKDLEDLYLNSVNSKPIFLRDGSVSLSTCDKYGINEKCVLFVSEYDVASVPNGATPDAEYYDIENFRDFLVCGYYFHNEEGPSFFQKLLEDSYSRKDTEYGLATFLVWEDIEEGVSTSDLSRLDLEFFQEISNGIILRGAPGCKSQQMCSLTPDMYVGQFKLSRESIENYLTYSDFNNVHFHCNNWAECWGDYTP
ncbi:MAG: hypothetical protein PHU63_01465 [Candidatus ainarchaeum sp.]|nr:hypothetical protein [Candidatus ainarchaeum sp.]